MKKLEIESAIWWPFQGVEVCVKEPGSRSTWGKFWEQFEQDETLDSDQLLRRAVDLACSRAVAAYRCKEDEAEAKELADKAMAAAVRGDDQIWRIG